MLLRCIIIILQDSEIHFFRTESPIAICVLIRLVLVKLGGFKATLVRSFGTLSLVKEIGG